ncbi:MAG TPA: hypothetical protein VL595_11610 [Pseudonocardia sp.]|nr:hypothetical protein [Pseudonocardia sp.]
MFTELAWVAHIATHHAITLAANVAPAQSLPNPAPVAPPGAEKITQVVGYIKWGAGLALLAGFFAGVLVFAGGRWVDHHRAGRVGSTMIISSLFGGLLYGIGYTMISSFAGGK